MVTVCVRRKCLRKMGDKSKDGACRNPTISNYLLSCNANVRSTRDTRTLATSFWPRTLGDRFLSRCAGGTEEDPQWSFCSQLTLCEDTGCTHNLEDESDYDGMVHQSEKGDFCLDWSDFPDYAEVAIANNWGSSCRNLPNGDKARAWCFTGTVSDATPAYCDIGRRCPPEHDEKEPPDDDDDEGETGDSNPAGLSSATSRSSPRRAALMYARSAEEARARLNQQMETMGYSMPDEL
jgi:hypothetical protein